MHLRRQPAGGGGARRQRPRVRDAVVYRTEFTVADGARATHTWLRIDGMIPGADVWLNGQLVADQAPSPCLFVHELE